MVRDNGESRPPSKRRKVAESCKVCRAKKTRCDGQRPVCSPCITKDISCEYDDATVPVAASTLSDIEARLRKLEGQATRPVTPRGQRLYSPSGCPPPSGPYPSAGDPDPGTELPFKDHLTSRFIQEIRQIADIQFPARLQESLREKPNAWPVETDTLSMVVPQRAMADDFLDSYEKHIHPLFPILHMPTFRESYKRLWQPQTGGQFESLVGEATFYATLNIVFALGCLNNSKVEPRLKLRTADSFYRRARVLLPLDALDIPSLEVVQCLLLTTNYLSFTRYSNRCCNTLAVAIRIAQALGLHMDVESPSSNKLKREISRRVWHHCLTLERYVY